MRKYFVFLREMDAAKRFAGSLFLILVVLFFSNIAPVCAADGASKNVILLVADGMGPTHTTIARWYKGSALNLDSMYIGGMRSYSADSLITDSAPAATAFACGQKAQDKTIGIMPQRVTIPGIPDPGGHGGKPIASILEGAKLTGRRTGIVATSNVQHATPAAFSSHWPDRNDFEEIARQQVHEKIDVVLGGGRVFLLPGKNGGARKDGEDLTHVLLSRGYAIVTTRKDILSSSSDRLWGLFADRAMAYELDRRTFPGNEPSLAEMTNKALEVLSHGKGFFLFVEGSKIDWASHSHDPVGVIGDVLAFDEAVGVALDFALKNGNTIVLAVSDHGTGGMSLGNAKSDAMYSRMQVNDLVSPMKKAICTGEGLERVLGDRSDETIRDAVRKYFGITDLTEAEIKDIRSAKPGRMIVVTGQIVTRRSHVGWTTHGHTGEDLFFYYRGIEKPLPILENSDIAHMLAREMDFDLKEIDRELFVDAGEAFGSIGASVVIDSSIPSRRVLIVEKKGKSARLIVSTNIMEISARQVRVHELNGIVVFSPATGKVYIPREAVAIFERAM